MKPRYKHSLAILCLSLTAFFFSSISYAQTAYASFGTLYGASTSSTVYVQVQGTEAIRGQFNGGGSTQLPVGTVNVPSSFFLSGTGQVLSLPVTFTANGTSGSISGGFTASYTCSSDCTQSSLSISVSVTGNIIVATATAGLKYQVLSVLYTAPGNASSSGFSNSVSEGSTTSVSQNFSTTDSISFGGGIAGNISSVTFSTGQAYGNTSAFTTSYQATTGAQLSSVTQAMDHTQDQVFLSVDPSITVTQTGASSGSYVVGPSLDATGSFGSSGPPADILNSNIAGFKNPSLIPVSYLKPQVTQPGTTLPGLSYICANPLPANQCTQQNACGCAPADFAAIIPQDELANDTVDSTQPSTIDPARYVYVDYEPLEGPQQSGSGPVKFTYGITDGNMSSETLSNGTSYSVGYSHGFKLNGPFSLQITATNTFTYSQTETAGISHGTAHTATVTLGSSDVGCQEYVDIYEDTTYHTFAYALSQPAPANCQ